MKVADAGAGKDLAKLPGEPGHIAQHGRGNGQPIPAPQLSPVINGSDQRLVAQIVKMLAQIQRRYLDAALLDEAQKFLNLRRRLHPQVVLRLPCRFHHPLETRVGIPVGAGAAILDGRIGIAVVQVHHLGGRVGEPHIAMGVVENGDRPLPGRPDGDHLGLAAPAQDQCHSKRGLFLRSGHLEFANAVTLRQDAEVDGLRHVEDARRFRGAHLNARLRGPAQFLDVQENDALIVAVNDRWFNGPFELDALAGGRCHGRLLLSGLAERPNEKAFPARALQSSGGIWRDIAELSKEKGW